MDDERADYRVFISYSHANSADARWLQRKLESYVIPKRIRRDSNHRLGAVFLDHERLATSASLSDSIKEALTRSETMVVVCSPDAATSHWVNLEINEFKKLGRSDRIYPVIVDAPDTDFKRIFPEALLSDGDEPMAADLRPDADGRRGAVLRLVAGILEVGLDDLVRKDTQRRHRRILGFASLSLLGMIVALATAFYAFVQRDKAQIAAEQARRTSEFLEDLFRVSDPSEARGRTITAREILDRGEARIKAELNEEPEVRQHLMAIMGRVYMRLGLFGQAEPLLAEAKDLAEELYDVMDERSFQARSDLGELYFNTSMYPSSEALYRTNLTLAEGQADVGVHARALSALGTMKIYVADYDEARALLEEAMVLYRAHPGLEGYPECLNSLGSVMQIVGEIEAAERAFVQAATLIAERYGRSHPYHLIALADLAEVYTVQGRYAEAEETINRALDIGRKIYREDHVELLELREQYAGILGRLGRFGEANELYETTITTTLDKLGERHTLSARMLSDFATTLIRQGDYVRAEELLVRALGVQRKTYGRSHIRVATILNNMGGLELQRGNYAKAIEPLSEGLAMRRELFGESHPDVGNSLNNLGMAHLEIGNDDIALALLRQALDIANTHFDKPHPRIASGEANLGIALNRRHEYTAALELGRSAETDFKLVYGGDHWREAVARGVQGNALRGLDRFDEAEPMLLESYRQVEEATGSSTYTEHALRRLVLLYRDVGDDGKASVYETLLVK